jgi:hypothetical protein
MSTVDPTKHWIDKVNALEKKAIDLNEALNVAIECLKRAIPPGHVPSVNTRASVMDAQQTLERLKQMGVKL